MSRPIAFGRVEVQRMIATLAQATLTQHVDLDEVRGLLEDRLYEYDVDAEEDAALADFEQLVADSYDEEDSS